MIVNQQNLSALFTGYQAAYNMGFRLAEPMADKLATTVPSSTKSETYGWLGQFPKLREWVGDRQVKSISAFGYSILNKDFESTIGVPKNDIMDDTYGVFSPLFQEMGYAASTHKDDLVFNLLAAGFTTACYDGQFFFDTDHPVGNGESIPVASVSNYQAGAGNPWYLLDTSRPLKPLLFQNRQDYNFQTMNTPEDEAVFMRKEYRYGVDARCNVGYGFWQLAYASKATLDQTNFDAAYAAMMNFKSDEGRPIGAKPKLLVCGPSNRAAALDTILTARLASGADNKNYNAVEVHVSSWLP